MCARSPTRLQRVLAVDGFYKFLELFSAFCCVRICLRNELSCCENHGISVMLLWFEILCEK